MKIIFKIARTELQKLFYSPVAWLILVVFTFQVAIVYVDLYSELVRRQSLGWTIYSGTLSTFAGMRGLFTIVQTYLYLYIPLVTMGIMSRELGSGSIKLLYSSPLTNRQIVLGKYLALVLFGFSLIVILGVFGIYTVCTLDFVDWPVIVSGLLGLFLLICAYAAIGLFMSSLTSYTVVAAMGTLGIFAILNYIRGVGQEIEFVRDITYWLAISGRVNTFIAGMITSEDVLYFLIVIALFISFTIIKLQAGRVKSSWLVNFGKYFGVFAIAMLIGYISDKPSMMGYLDVTRNKTNTLTVAGQEVMKQLDDKVTITTYTNMLEPNYYLALPQNYKSDVDRFKHYLRFKPDIEMKYVYYYHKAENEHLDRQYPKLNDEERMDTLRKINNWKFDIVPYSDIQDKVDLAPENFRFVRLIERENGQRTFLRVFDDIMRLPSEAEISAAFKRLTINLPVVGFLTGHGERSSTNAFDRGYKVFAEEKSFRYALINQGFDFQDVTLSKPVPENILILVIAEPRSLLTEEENKHLDEYIARGGNLLLTGESAKREFVNPIANKLGINFMPGTLVKPSEKFQPDLLTLKPTKEAIEFSHHFETMQRRNALLTMPTASALEVTEDKGFKVVTLFTSDSTHGWNEVETTNFVDDTVSFNPAVEVKQPYPTVLALSRKVNDKEQKIIVTGDADWLSNAELRTSRKDLIAGNFYMIMASFYWMSDEEVPIDMRRDPSLDRSLSIGEDGWAISKVFLKWVFPIILIVIGTLIWIRRRGR